MRPAPAISAGPVAAPPAAPPSVVMSLPRPPLPPCPLRHDMQPPLIPLRLDPSHPPPSPSTPPPLPTRYRSLRRIRFHSLLRLCLRPPPASSSPPSPVSLPEFSISVSAPTPSFISDRSPIPCFSLSDADQLATMVLTFVKAPPEPAVRAAGISERLWLVFLARCRGLVELCVAGMLPEARLPMVLLSNSAGIDWMDVPRGRLPACVMVIDAVKMFCRSGLAVDEVDMSCLLGCWNGAVSSFSLCWSFTDVGVKRQWGSPEGLFPTFLHLPLCFCWGISAGCSGEWLAGLGRLAGDARCGRRLELVSVWWFCWVGRKDVFRRFSPLPLCSWSWRLLGPPLILFPAAGRMEPSEREDGLADCAGAGVLGVLTAVIAGIG